MRPDRVVGVTVTAACILAGCSRGSSTTSSFGPAIAIPFTDWSKRSRCEFGCDRPPHENGTTQFTYELDTPYVEAEAQGDQALGGWKKAVGKNHINWNKNDPLAGVSRASITISPISNEGSSKTYVSFIEERP